MWTLCACMTVQLQAQTTSLGDAVDIPSLTWTVGDNQPWIRQTEASSDGVAAPRPDRQTHLGQSAGGLPRIVAPGALLRSRDAASVPPLAATADFAPESLTAGDRLILTGTWTDSVHGALSGSATYEILSPTTANADGETFSFTYVKTGPNAATLSYAYSEDIGGGVTYEDSGSTRLTFATSSEGTFTSFSSYVYRGFPLEEKGTITGNGSFNYSGAGGGDDGGGGGGGGVGGGGGDGGAGGGGGGGTLADAVDAPQLTWTTGGNQPWVFQTSVTRDGVDAARSGIIGHIQQSWIQTTVTGPGTLVFWWKVSSEDDFDFLEFHLNDVKQSGSISGNVDWQRREMELSAGSQTLRWRYSKDSSDSSNQDRGWVDMVSFTPSGGPPTIISNPTSRTAEAGSTVTFEVVAGGALPLTYRWYHNGAVVTGAEGSSLTLQNLSFSDAGQYTVSVQNSFNTVTSAPTVLTVIPASLDTTFNPGADRSVSALAVQADGKILVGGRFDSLSGQARKYLGRLNPDGSLDTTFSAEANGVVLSIAIQSDGRILVGGQFTTLGGGTRDGLGRLNVDGSLDQGFAPILGGRSPDVNCVAVQADGKIVVAGFFETINGQRHQNIGRLNANGTVDGSFNPSVDLAVASIALQPDGKVVVGGAFRTLTGNPNDRTINIGRLNSNGTLDGGWNLQMALEQTVNRVAVQPDGMVLITGSFTEIDGLPRAGIARINTSGDVDTGFNPGIGGRNSGTWVSSLAIQADGKILVGGNFTTLGGQPRSHIGRLNPNGTIDPTFNPGTTTDAVSALAIQPDGKILVGGAFTTLGGQPRSYIGRLENTEPATQSLTLDHQILTWLRGGTGPEIRLATLEDSADGVNWRFVPLPPSRIEGGWEWREIVTYRDGLLRARGYVSGDGSGSGWFVESILAAGETTPPILVRSVRTSAGLELSWTGGTGPFQVQQTTSLSTPVSWQNVGDPVAANSLTLPIEPGTLFWRVRQP